jgi:hypothetical protein
MTQRSHPHGPSGQVPPAKSVEALIVDLAKHDATVRESARRRLASIGWAATPALIQALADKRTIVRWEAAKTLVDVADPLAAPALVATLEDEDSGTRWVGAEALIALGRDGLESLFWALVQRSDSIWLCEGAHHVLHELREGKLSDIVMPVFTALDGPAPEDAAPVAASEALDKLRE